MGRFFQGYEWRFLFATTPSVQAGVDASGGGITTSWASGLLSDRQITLALNQPTIISAAVWPDDKRVNSIFVGDADPNIAQSNRLIYCFRREGGSPPWKCRAAGILMNPEDQSDADIPLSHIVAFDPWQYLMGRPVLNALGQLPSQTGYQFLATPGSDIVRQILKNTIAQTTVAGGGFAFIDAGLAWGGTSFYNGHVDTTAAINYDVQPGTMVGDAWTQICDTGNLDIVLTPIYDPVNRPGYTHELNIYPLAGSEKPAAVFAWDRFSRNLSSIDRNHSGEPGDFVNIVEYYVGQGGPPVPLQKNAASVAKYLPYWSQQFFPSQTADETLFATAVVAFAQQALVLAKQGKRTMTLTPTPERAPIPLIEYGIGDRVDIRASKRLRVTADGFQRVQSIPFVIDDDGIESVPGLLCSPDWRDVQPPAAPPGPTVTTSTSIATSLARQRRGV